MVIPSIDSPTDFEDFEWYFRNKSADYVLGYKACMRADFSGQPPLAPPDFIEGWYAALADYREITAYGDDLT